MCSRAFSRSSSSWSLLSSSLMPAILPWRASMLATRVAGRTPFNDVYSVRL